jgi:hypothetical protein
MAKKKPAARSTVINAANLKCLEQSQRGQSERDFADDPQAVKATLDLFSRLSAYDQAELLVRIYTEFPRWSQAQKSYKEALKELAVQAVRTAIAKDPRNRRGKRLFPERDKRIVELLQKYTPQEIYDNFRDELAKLGGKITVGSIEQVGKRAKSRS